MVSVQEMIAISIGLVIVFIIGSSILMPQFSSAWKFCQAREWVATQGGVMTNCTTPYQTANTSFVDTTGGTHTEGGLASPINADTGVPVDAFCLNCSTLGGYRGTVQGLVLLLLVLFLIGVGMRFFGR